MQSASTNSQPLGGRALWLANVGIWTVLGVADAVDYLVSWRLQGRPEPIWRALAVAMPGWWAWVLLTPLVFWLAHRARLTWPASAGTLMLHMSASVVVGIVDASVHAVFGWMFSLRGVQVPLIEDYAGTILDWLPVSILIYWAVLAIAYGLDSYRRLQAIEVERAELARSLSEARMEALTAQLHPHFLFNTLNAAVALVRTHDDANGIRVLTQLGEILRHLLRAPTVQEVPLREELGFVERYLEIERFRFSHRLTVSVQVPDALLACAVPNLILQPLVENAIRHGLATHDGAMTIAIAAAAEEGRLRLTVTDDGPGLPAGWSLEHSLGIGLGNTAARLQHLYGAAGSLAVRNGPASGVRATISLPQRFLAGNGAAPEAVSR